jgi:chorismate mutase/prephenate dehydrogenase
MADEGAGRPGPDAPDADAPPADGERSLDELRERILAVDEALIALVGERRDLVLRVGRLKATLGRPVLDPAREAEVVRRAAELARARGVDEELVRDIVWRIIASARDAQEGRTRWGPPEGGIGPDGS